MQTMSKRKITRRSAQSGQAIVIIALGMIALLAFMVLAIDGSHYFDQRRTSQNAADSGSLSGMYAAYHDSNPTYADVLAKINTAAEANGIPDPDSIPGDAINANVSAYWINGSGDYVPNTANTIETGCSGAVVVTGSGSVEPPVPCATIENSTTLYEPAGASGIKVRAVLPYTAFVGHLIGQHSLQVQADGTSMVSLGPNGTNPPTNCNGPCAITAGGSNCTTATNAALYWGGGTGHSNNSSWGTGVFVNGYLEFNTMPNTLNKAGNPAQTGVIVSVSTPQTQYDGSFPSGEVPNPSGDSATWTTQVYNYYGAGSSLAVYTPPFDPWGWLKAGQLYAQGTTRIPPSKVQIQAYFYRPYVEDIQHSDIVDTPKTPYLNGTAYAQISSTAAAVKTGSNSSTPNWIFKGLEYAINVPVPSPATPFPLYFFHYINDTANTSPVRTAAQQNGYDLQQMAQHGETGIFFIDGDLDTSYTWPDGVTVVATGTIVASGGGTYGNAGRWARSMTALAGGTYTGSLASATLNRNGVVPSVPDLSCANTNTQTYSILNFAGTNMTYWDGILYVPNGSLWIDFNQNNGCGTNCDGPVFAWSMGVDLPGHPANNFHFSTCTASCYPDPTYVLGIQQ